MKIAICDDCREDIRQLEEYIRKSKFYSDAFTFYEYLCGEELLNNYRDYDAIFLDIKIQGGMNGASVAHQIRKRDAKVLITFYSDFESMASKISSIRPYDYLLKKYPNEILVQYLDRVLEEIQNKKEVPKLPVVCNGQIYVLHLEDIIFIQIYKKGSHIWLTKKKAEEIGRQTIETSTKLKEYHQLLNSYGYIFAGESYLIYAENVLSRQGNDVLLRDGYKIPVARRKKKMFDEELGNYYGNQYRRERKKIE